MLYNNGYQNNLEMVIDKFQNKFSEIILSIAIDIYSPSQDNQIRSLRGARRQELPCKYSFSTCFGSLHRLGAEPSVPVNSRCAGGAVEAKILQTTAALGCRMDCAIQKILEQADCRW